MFFKRKKKGQGVVLKSHHASTRSCTCTLIWAAFREALALHGPGLFPRCLQPPRAVWLKGNTSRASHLPPPGCCSSRHRLPPPADLYTHSADVSKSSWSDLGGHLASLRAQVDLSPRGRERHIRENLFLMTSFLSKGTETTDLGIQD